MPERAAPPVFELRGVSYAYPRASGDALDQVDFEVAEAGLTCVIGPNGAGKSTIVRLLGGRARPRLGEVRCLGRPLEDWDRPALARRLAIVTQDAPQRGLPLTVRDYVELGRNPYVSPWAALGPEDLGIVRASLELAELGGLEMRQLSELSGGERQRAKMARALAQEPEILVLDEPTAHLDFRHALWVFESLRALVEARGLTVACITHDMNLASRYADRVVLLAEGRVVAAGPPAEVLQSPHLARAYECDVQVRAVGDLGWVVVPVRSGAALEAPV